MTSTSARMKGGKQHYGGGDSKAGTGRGVGQSGGNNVKAIQTHSTGTGKVRGTGNK
jgi:hypothetical protein